MALDPLMIPAASLARPTTTFATPATITVRRVALCPLRLFTEALLARARGIKPLPPSSLGLVPISIRNPRRAHSSSPLPG
jgi:hypothetical protein